MDIKKDSNAKYEIAAKQLVAAAIIALINISCFSKHNTSKIFSDMRGKRLETFMFHLDGG